MKGVTILLLLFFISCSKDKEVVHTLLPNQVDYWFEGLAEVNSYKLNQARYGRQFDGTVTLIYVTEDYSRKSQTKADEPGKDVISILKMIRIKKFGTGVYDYSIMTSTFFPFQKGMMSLKTTTTTQEWCGHTYLEIINGKKLEVDYSSYYQDEELEGERLKKEYMEDDIWTWIRIRSENLPTGNIKMIPSTSYLSIEHKEFRAYEATASLYSIEGRQVYKITYPDLNRTLEIEFEPAFPFRILAWTESYPGSSKKQGTVVKTKANRLNTIRIDYWNKNKPSDSRYRKLLQLE